MALFPLFVELDGLDILIVGGGQVAKRKALSLAEYGALVRLVAPKFCRELEEDGSFRLTRRGFLESDLEGASLVISATGDRELNRCVSLLCRERGLPVNVVDEPADCSFIFPALLRRGALSAGITTGGVQPQRRRLGAGQAGRGPAAGHGVHARLARRAARGDKTPRPGYHEAQRTVRAAVCALPEPGPRA